MAIEIKNSQETAPPMMRGLAVLQRRAPRQNRVGPAKVPWGAKASAGWINLAAAALDRETHSFLSSRDLGRADRAAGGASRPFGS